jgi:hypothetical protein
VGKRRLVAYQERHDACSLEASMTGHGARLPLVFLLFFLGCTDPLEAAPVVVVRRPRALHTTAPASAAPPPSTLAPALPPAASDPADAGESAPPDADASALAEESRVLAILASGAYKTSPAFRAVSTAGYPSAIAGSPTIRVWVSADAYDAYAAIAPDVTGGGAVLPRGATIVREVAGDGGVAKITAMTKGVVGQNPTLGDYWFAATDAVGTPLVDNGVPLVGNLAACAGCHLTRPADDYLFGVPAARRDPAPTP